MHSRRYNGFFFGFLSSFPMIGRVAGQITTPFTWGPGIAPTSLRECQPFAMHTTAIPGGTLHPPFYLIAYEPGGPATISNIGSDHVNLSWTVNYPAGSQVIIQIVDSLGASGGTGPHVYPINPGTTSACHSAPVSPIKMSVNASRLDTCDYLKIDIEGGTKPYVVTFAGVNSNGGLNATMGPNDNEYIWVNRLAPGQEMIAVVSDAHGVYSNTSPLIPTAGTRDLTCGSEQSKSGIQGGAVSPTAAATTASPTHTTAHASSSAAAPAHTAGGAKSSSATHSSAGPIVGGVVGGIGAAIILAVLAFCFMKRRRENQDSPTDPFTSHLKSEPFNLADDSFGNRARPTDQFARDRRGYMPEHNVAPTLYGYNYANAGDESAEGKQRTTSSMNLSAKYPTPTPSSAGSDTCYYGMSSPAVSHTKLESSYFGSPVQRTPPPGFSNAFYAAGVSVQNHGKPGTPPDKQTAPSSVFIAGRRSPLPQIPNPSQPQHPGPPKGMMLVDRVPNVMRVLQPAQSPHRKPPPVITDQQQPQPQQPLTGAQLYQSYTSPTQRTATPSSTEPASVTYARSRNSLFSNSAMSSGSTGTQTTAQIVHTAQYPQPINRIQSETHPIPPRTDSSSGKAGKSRALPKDTDSLLPSMRGGAGAHSSSSRHDREQKPVKAEDDEGGEGDTLLAYARSSIASSISSEASHYPPTLRNGPPVVPRNSKASAPPPVPPLRVHQHEDGGPVMEVPPAYRDRYSKQQPRSQSRTGQRK